MASEDLHDVNTCSTMIPVLTRLTWRPVTWKEGREKRRKFGYCQVRSSEHIAGIQWSRLQTDVATRFWCLFRFLRADSKGAIFFLGGGEGCGGDCKLRDEKYEKDSDLGNEEKRLERIHVLQCKGKVLAWAPANAANLLQVPVNVDVLVQVPVLAAILVYNIRDGCQAALTHPPGACGGQSAAAFIQSFLAALKARPGRVWGHLTLTSCSGGQVRRIISPVS